VIVWRGRASSGARSWLTGRRELGFETDQPDSGGIEQASGSTIAP